jgi:hypothetical protein
MIDLRAGPYLRSIWPATSGVLAMSVVVLLVRAALPAELALAGRLAVQVAAAD